MANQLIKAIQENQRYFNFDGSEARLRIEQMLSQPLFPAEQEKVYQTLARYAKFHFAQQLAEKYPVISREIFELRRKQQTEMKRDNWESSEKYTFEIPTVIQLPLNKTNRGVYTTEVRGLSMVGHTTNIKISCQIPEVTADARAAISESIKYSAELTADAYRDNLISKILIRTQKTESKIDTPLDAEYHLMWAPSVWDAEVIERDPAILMSYHGANFLVYQWEIPKERSLDTMLKEFTQELDRQNKTLIPQ